jgi:hypothetical protein
MQMTPIPAKVLTIAKQSRLPKSRPHSRRIVPVADDSAMSNDTDNADDNIWLRGISAEELVLMHDVADVIDGSSARTSESRRAVSEIRQELDQRGNLPSHFDDDSNNERVKRWLKEKPWQHRRRRRSS